MKKEKKKKENEETDLSGGSKKLNEEISLFQWTTMNSKSEYTENDRSDIQTVQYSSPLLRPRLRLPSRHSSLKRPVITKEDIDEERKEI
uniref:Uncharacterized protein n=1 Tax=Caenorhabditis japonica TaxID=281687 RepID=A0A8R1E7M4_CAEJA